MPELPEVETIARGLDRRLAGDRIEAVWIGGKKEVLKSPAGEIERVLRGARIVGFRRVGKHIVGELETAAGAAQWVIHLGMTGRCVVCGPEVERAKHTHLIATLGSGRELRFVDPRRFGRLQVIEELPLREATMALLDAVTGLRASELIALKWKDVQWKLGTLRSQRALSQGELKETKSCDNHLPLAKTIMEALRLWREHTPYRGEEDWIFASPFFHGKTPYLPGNRKGRNLHPSPL